MTAIRCHISTCRYCGETNAFDAPGPDGELSDWVADWLARGDTVRAVIDPDEVVQLGCTCWRKKAKVS